jgi:Spy/CpxP family protein refolding chaperone
MRSPQLLAALLFVALPSAALAQQAPAPESTTQQPSFDDRGHRGHGPMGALKQLNLSDTQKQQVSQLMQSVKSQNASLFEQQQSLHEQMREAHDAGDEAKIQSLRSQMEALRPQMKVVHQQMEQGISQILTPEQATKLAQIKASHQSRHSVPPTQ